MDDQSVADVGGSADLALVLDALAGSAMRFVTAIVPDEDHDASRLVRDALGFPVPPDTPAFSFSGLGIGHSLLLVGFSMPRLRALAELSIKKGLRAEDPVMRLVGDVPEQVLLRLEAARMSPRLADMLVRTSAEHLADKALECVFATLGPVAVRGPVVTALLAMPLSDRNRATLTDVIPVASSLVLFRS